MPALVVAMAGKPACSKMRALAQSQALGRTKISGPRCSEAKNSAFSFCVFMGTLYSSPAARVVLNCRGGVTGHGKRRRASSTGRACVAARLETGFAAVYFATGVAFVDVNIKVIRSEERR